MFRTRSLLLGAALLGLPASAFAQAPAPEVMLAGPNCCPAHVFVIWDVSSVAGATGARIRVRRNGQNVENRAVTGTSGQENIDLRSLGKPILDGSEWVVQVRARAGGTNLGDWSPPSAVEMPTLTPDFVLAHLGGREVELTWDLNPERPWAACADRFVWEVSDGHLENGGAETADGGVENGVAARVVTGAADSAPTYARIAGRHGGEGPDDAIGVWSSERAAEPADLVHTTFKVHVLDYEATACTGQPVPRNDAQVTLIVGGVPGHTVSVDGNGVAEIPYFAPDPGSFEILAEGTAAAGSCRARVPADVSEETHISLAGCTQPGGDRSVAFAAGSVLQPRVPVQLRVIVRGGDGFVGPGGTVVVSKIASNGARTTVGQRNVGAVCSGEEQALGFVDRTSGQASEILYEVTIDPPDADASSDRATLTLRSTLPTGRPAPTGPLDDPNPTGLPGRP